MQGDDEVLDTRGAAGDGGRVVALGLGSIGHNNGFRNLAVLVGSDTGLVDAEHAVLVVEGKGHIACQVTTRESELAALSVVLVAGERQVALVGLEAGCAEGRLDADNHLLVLVEGRAAAVEGVQGIVVVAGAAPTEVDVVLVVGSVIAVNVEGVATAEETTGDSAEHDGTSLNEFFLNHGSPLGIGVEGGATAVGAGLLDKAHGLLVIAEELEGVGNQRHAVGVHTAAAC